MTINKDIETHSYLKFLIPNQILRRLLSVNPKGQLILKCPFGVFKSSKKLTNFFPDFCPSL